MKDLLFNAIQLLFVEAFIVGIILCLLWDTFDGLLLEINCNLWTIDAESVMKQFNESLQSRIDSAREIMRDNLANIVKHAQEYRNQN